MWKEKWIDLLPQRLLLFFARPYLGGYSMEEALEVSRELWQQHKLLATIDLLGEEIQCPQKAESTKEVYLRLVRMLREQWPEEESRPTVSLKPSSLVPHRVEEGKLLLDRDLLEENLRAILETAKECQIGVTIDMEDRHWTDITLELYEQFFPLGNVGTVLQSRLFRTKEDIERIPEGSRIRLCIGIYREPPEVALTDKRAMKAKLLEYGQRLLERKVYLELATHDEEVIRRFLQEIYHPEEHQGRLEVQMLLGVPRQRIQQALVRGSLLPSVPPVPVRIYVPFAEHPEDAYAYLKRRLVANPHIFSYGLRNLVGRSQKR